MCSLFLPLAHVAFSQEHKFSGLWRSGLGTDINSLLLPPVSRQSKEPRRKGGKQSPTLVRRNLAEGWAVGRSGELQSFLPSISHTPSQHYPLSTWPCCAHNCIGRWKTIQADLVSALGLSCPSQREATVSWAGLQLPWAALNILGSCSRWPSPPRGELGKVCSECTEGSLRLFPVGPHQRQVRNAKENRTRSI